MNYEPIQLRPWGQWAWYSDARRSGVATRDASDLPDELFRRLAGGDGNQWHRAYPTREAALRALEEAKAIDYPEGAKAC